MGNTTWLLVADASKARVYTLNKARLFREKSDKNLTLLSEHTHSASRKKGTQLAQDKLGGFGTGTFVEATDLKRYEAERFAQELIEKLEAGRNENNFRDLIIVAPPAFLGLLHKHVSDNLRKMISQTIEKDYTQYNERELIANLLNHL